MRISTFHAQGLSILREQHHRHVLIDEYQDTNLLQHRFMRCLVGPEQNICVVGDDDQSIYGFVHFANGPIASGESDRLGALLFTVEILV